MITQGQIQEIADRIRQSLDPQRIVLFGSYADGTATEDSDLDLMIVTDRSAPPSQRYAQVRRLLGNVPIAMDLVVKTPEEFERWKKVVNTIVYFADRYGKVLYAG